MQAQRHSRNQWTIIYRVLFPKGTFIPKSFLCQGRFAMWLAWTNVSSSPLLSVLSHLPQVVDLILDYISVFHEQGSVGLCHFPLRS